MFFEISISDISGHNAQKTDEKYSKILHQVSKYTMYILYDTYIVKNFF